MLTNMVIKVTFSNLRAQQISAIIFQSGVLYNTELDFLCFFIHQRSEKKFLQIPRIILSLKGNIVWTQSQII